MHGKIFQVSLNPIGRADYITECDYYDNWLVNTFADYVADCDRDEPLMWLKDTITVRGCSTGQDDNGEYFVVENKEEYFQQLFSRFRELVCKIENHTLQDFTVGFDGDMWALKNDYEEKYGFYIDADGELMTLDAFIRKCVRGEKYYLGGVVDYHF